MLIEKEATYPIDEALELLKKTSKVKFDASCEVHFHMGLDPTQADQNLRMAVTLPHGTGKEITIVAFVDDASVKAAKAAGAAEAGSDELIDKIEKGWTDFDVAVATPDQMKNLGRIAKILGQKRLMPSPKAGTVTPDFEKVIAELKQGKIEVRIDKLSNFHNLFGKVSFDNAKLKENLQAILKTIQDNKPSSSKGTYIKSMTLASSMGPGVRVEVSSVLAK